MFAKDLIDNAIAPVKRSDNCLQIITWMEENKVSQLPVVENRAYYGLISEREIYNLQEPDVEVGKLQHRIRNIAVHQGQFFNHVLNYMVNERLTVLPVLDEQTNYFGLISQQSLIKGLSRLFGIEHPGAIIVLEMHQSDYMLSQIGQIAEANDVKILNLFTTPHQDSMLMDIIIKTTSEQVDSLISTFERYDYSVKVTLSEQDIEWEELKENYDYMMNYLNI